MIQELLMHLGEACLINDALEITKYIIKDELGFGSFAFGFTRQGCSKRLRVTVFDN